MAVGRGAPLTECLARCGHRRHHSSPCAPLPWEEYFVIKLLLYLGLLVFICYWLPMSFFPNSRWPQPTHLMPPPSFSPPPPPTITTNPLRPHAHFVDSPLVENSISNSTTDGGADNTLFVPAPSEVPPTPPLLDAPPLSLPTPVVVVVSSPFSPSATFSDPSPPPTVDATKLVGKDRFWFNVQLLLHPTPGSMGVCGLLVGFTFAILTVALFIPSGVVTPPAVGASPPPATLTPSCCSTSVAFSYEADIIERGWSYVPDSQWDTSKWGAPLGPTHWDTLLDSDGVTLMFPECSPTFRNQSPIALSSSTSIPTEGYILNRAYNASTFTIGPRPERTPGWRVFLEDEGVRQAQVWEVEGEEYTFSEVHFHSPSEHTLDGVRYPLEGHFLHNSLTGQYAVFSILYPHAEGEDPNPFLAPFWDSQFTPSLRGVPAFNLSGAINDIAPRCYHYEGSTTVPPCRQASWFVATSKQGVSSGQLAEFRQRYQLLPSSGRPTQPLGGRQVDAYDLA